MALITLALGRSGVNVIKLIVCLIYMGKNYLRNAKGIFQLIVCATNLQICLLGFEFGELFVSEKIFEIHLFRSSNENTYGFNSFSFQSINLLAHFIFKIISVIIKLFTRRAPWSRGRTFAGSPGSNPAYSSYFWPLKSIWRTWNDLFYLSRKAEVQ